MTLNKLERMVWIKMISEYEVKIKISVQLTISYIFEVGGLKESF